jgi:hypothetical protein
MWENPPTERIHCCKISLYGCFAFALLKVTVIFFPQFIGCGTPATLQYYFSLKVINYPEPTDNIMS